MPKEKTSVLNSYNIWVSNYLFLKNYITSQEAFLTKFYDIKSSLLLVTKKVFMLRIILSNYSAY